MRFIFLILLFAAAHATAAPVDYQRRGIEHFFKGEIDEAIKDFDTYLASNPRAAPYHWQRGIALYYAGRFDEGAVQFETHQEVNPRDVENAVWLFLCNARAISLTTARASITPYTYDPRVPMRQIHDLFAGTGTKQAVLDAAKRGNPSASRAPQPPLLRPPLPRPPRRSLRRSKARPRAHQESCHHLFRVSLHGQNRQSAPEARRSAKPSPRSRGNPRGKPSPPQPRSPRPIRRAFSNDAV